MLIEAFAIWPNEGQATLAIAGSNLTGVDSARSSHSERALEVQFFARPPFSHPFCPLLPYGRDRSGGIVALITRRTSTRSARSGSSVRPVCCSVTIALLFQPGARCPASSLPGRAPLRRCLATVVAPDPFQHPVPHSPHSRPLRLCSYLHSTVEHEIKQRSINLIAEDPFIDGSRAAMCDNTESAGEHPQAVPPSGVFEDTE